MIMGPMKWYEVAVALQQAVFTGLSVKPQRAGVVPGAIAWDECDCGMLAVSLNQVYMSEIFPNPAGQKVGACDAPYEVGEFVIQIVRCAPNPVSLEQPAPSVLDLDASAKEVLLDAYELLKSASTELCQMKADREISDFFLRPLTAQGPLGGCVGNELRVLVSLPRN